jgi:hypothetical protein
VPVETERFGHEGDDVGLGKRLFVPDGNGKVAVGVHQVGLGNEPMALDARHRVEHAPVLDPPPYELLLHHARAARRHDGLEVFTAAVRSVHGDLVEA